MDEIKFRRILPLFIVLMLFPAIYTGFYPGKIVVVSAVCFGLASLLLIVFRKYLYLSDFDYRTVLQVLLIYNTITYIRGFFNIELPSDVYALCSNLIYTSFIVPFFVFLAHPRYLYIIFHSMLTWGLLCCLLCYWFPPSDGFMSFQHNMSFCNVFMLAIPYLKRKHIVLLTILAAWSVLYDTDRRSILISAIVPVVIVLLYPAIKVGAIKKISFFVTFSLPPILLLCGLLGVFNVFQDLNIDKDITLEENNRALYTDSRTGIYEDVFGELSRQNKLIYGLGANGKTYTSLLESVNQDYSPIYKKGRGGTEAGMLNYFQYGGIIGYFVYTLLFFGACYLAMFKSNNRFVCMLGFYMCFKYIYSYVEDANSMNASLFYFYIWLGICYCRLLRSMTDQQVKEYFHAIFSFNNGRKRLYY